MRGAKANWKHVVCLLYGDSLYLGESIMGGSTSQVCLIPACTAFARNFCWELQRFIQDFCSRGEIIACGNILKVGGSGGMLPQENFEIYNLLDCSVGGF